MQGAFLYPKMLAAGDDRAHRALHLCQSYNPPQWHHVGRQTAIAASAPWDAAAGWGAGVAGVASTLSDHRPVVVDLAITP